VSGKIENLSHIFELVSLGWFPSGFFCFSHFVFGGEVLGTLFDC
jgi:hypothetical protein